MTAIRAVTLSPVGDIRHREMMLRRGGNGSNWHMSRAEDDRRLVALDDGFGCGSPEIL